MIVAQDFVASFFLFHNEQDNINALAVAMSFNFVFALMTLFNPLTFRRPAGVTRDKQSHL